MEQHFVEEPCQEGWHRPVLSLFAKVSLDFSCKLPKATCFQKFAFAQRCANASFPHGRQNRLITPPAKKNRAFPTGNALLYISLLYVDFSGCVLFRGAPCFCFILTLPPHGAQPHSTEECRSFFLKNKLPRRNPLKGLSGKLL